MARDLRLLVLRADYARGAARAARAVLDERVSPEIVAVGRELREALLAAHARRHSGAGYRVLMLCPPSMTAEIWFGDLALSMNHAGIPCRVLPPSSNAEDINAEFESFAPNVFISTESPRALRTIDLPFVKRYKRAHGCLRLFIPVWKATAPRELAPVGHCTPQEDLERRRLRFQGLGPDALFSNFEPEFHEQFSHDPLVPEIEFVTMAQACNPFTDYPLPAAKRYDYIMATSMTEERVEVVCRYLRPVLSRYQGLWAGPKWGFGLREISPGDMPLRYAESRIALSPLVGFVHRYGAEVTHRVFAAAACGAFQITMPTAITSRYFRTDELVQAASPAEYTRLFDHYVTRPDERNAIALAGLRRVYAEHTCLHRVDTFVAHWNRWRRQGLF